jgi:1-acyl-sn-glycerol-3-phosphate acyltransferase
VGWHYSVARFAIGTTLRAVTGAEVRGREHVPRTGGLIVASNHISFWDPPFIGGFLPRELYYLAKEELFSNPVFGRVIRSYNAIPIRRGMVDLTGIARAVETLRQGGALLLFPEGSRMRDGELHPARPGLGNMAVTADVPIVPCYISGSNRPRRWLWRGTRVRLWFGPVRKWQDLIDPETDRTPGRPLYQRIADEVMREIGRLKVLQEQSASRGAA